MMATRHHLRALVILSALFLGWHVPAEAQSVIGLQISQDATQSEPVTLELGDLDAMLAQLRALQLPSVSKYLLNTMWAVCAALLLAGLLTVLLDAWNEHWYETVEDAFEWVLSLLLQSNFLLGYFVWRQADWQLVVKE